MPTPTYAVTAATGSLGRLVVDELLSRVDASEVVAVVRDPAKAADLAERGVTVRKADYSDLEALTAAFEGISEVVLISGSEVGQRVEQHRTVVDAAKAAGVAHIAYTSAPKADDTVLVLAPEHKATEQIIRESGLAFTLLRNNWYSENYASQLAPAAATGEIVGSAHAGLVASAGRVDYAAAAAAVVTGGSEHHGRVYELGGDVAWDYTTLAAAIGEVVGRPVSYRDVDTAEHITVLESVGLDSGTAGFVAQLDADIAAGCLAEVTGDLSRLIGRPTTPLKDTLAQVYAAG